MGNSVPSLRRPASSRPAPIDRVLGSARYPLRCATWIVELIGEQDLHGPADQLLAGVAEETFGLLVDERDAPEAIDDDRCVRGRVQEGPEALLAGPEDLNETGRRRTSDL